MPERAFAFETRAALDVELDDLRLCGQRRGELRAAGAEQCDHRLIQRGGQVHQAGIVADDQPRACQQRESIAQIGAAAQVDALRAGELVDFFSGMLVLAGTDQPYRIAVLSHNVCGNTAMRYG